jgi:NADH dehydrogenase (ubiquinone) 1 beta subcomplex subunit 6
MGQLPGTEADHSHTSGAKAMNIGGRLIYEKERLHGMTPEEREWRRKWLRDQELTPREPVQPKYYEKDLMNPIRRFYRKPLDVVFFNILEPVIGTTSATVGRVLTGKFLMGLTFVYLTYYYFKYNTNNWERTGGWRVVMSRVRVLPGDEGYPAPQTKTKGSEYANRDFPKSIYGQVVESGLDKSAPPAASGFRF